MNCSQHHEQEGVLGWGVSLSLAPFRAMSQVAQWRGWAVSCRCRAHAIRSVGRRKSDGGDQVSGSAQLLLLLGSGPSLL